MLGLGYSSFAVFGAGLVGAPIVHALHRRGARVVVGVRPGTKHQAQRLPENVPLVEVACTDYSALRKLCVDNTVQVVISTLSAADAEVQKVLAAAAQDAGVALFVPSEFGVVTEGVSEFVDVIGASVSELEGRFVKNVDYLKSRGFPYAKFYIGFFLETLAAMVGLCENSKINVVGYGNMPCSFTASADVAGFVAHVLTSLSPAELSNRTFRLQGDRSTICDLGQMFGTNVVFVERVPGAMGDIWTKMQCAGECGMASTGWDVDRRGEGEQSAGCTNYLWPGHEWTTIGAFYKLSSSSQNL
ncbi:NmrA domain-containing protein [Mycena kentingensis (nom. inval.)]|nr:NmrA domain-containing protein [Mycena kentingensis (nom. inval.)]